LSLCIHRKLSSTISTKHLVYLPPCHRVHLLQALFLQIPFDWGIDCLGHLESVFGSVASQKNLIFWSNLEGPLAATHRVAILHITNFVFLFFHNANYSIDSTEDVKLLFYHSSHGRREMLALTSNTKLALRYLFFIRATLPITRRLSTPIFIFFCQHLSCQTIFQKGVDNLQ